MSWIPQTFVRTVARLVSAFTGPRVIYGWRNASGTRCPHTRVSTHAAIENPERMELGDHVFIGHFNRIDGSGGLVIEEGVQVTNYVSVLSHTSHRSVRISGRRYFGDPDPADYVRKATRVGAYSFLGPHSIIAPGAQLGKGVIVQAYSFVSGVVPDFAIVGPRAPGQPAVVLGDTRDMDGPALLRHPQLQPVYAQWAGAEALAEALARARAKASSAGAA